MNGDMLGATNYHSFSLNARKVTVSPQNDGFIGGIKIWTLIYHKCLFFQMLNMCNLEIIDFSLVPDYSFESLNSGGSKTFKIRVFHNRIEGRENPTISCIDMAHPPM